MCKIFLGLLGKGGEGHLGNSSISLAGKMAKCHALFWKEGNDLLCHTSWGTISSSFLASLPSFLLLKDSTVHLPSDEPPPILVLIIITLLLFYYLITKFCPKLLQPNGL